MVCKFFPFICLLTITIVFHNCFIVLLNVRRYSHIIDFTINYLNNFSDLMVSLYFEIKETKGRKFQWTVQGPIGGENGSKILVAYFLTNVHDMHWRKKEGKYRCQGRRGGGNRRIFSKCCSITTVFPLSLADLLPSAPVFLLSSKRRK